MAATIYKIILEILCSLYSYIIANPWDITFDIITIVLTLLGLYFAKKIHNEFLKNHLKGKQVEHVCSIIEELNRPIIQIYYSTIEDNGGVSSVGFGAPLNIFELGHFEKADEDWKDKYDNEIVLLESKSHQILDIKKFVYHPLTPRSIADELMRFHIPFGQVIKPENSNLSFQSFVELETGIQKDNKILEDIKNNDFIFANASWLNLKETANSLKIVIEKWLDENGVSENNIRYFIETD